MDGTYVVVEDIMMNDVRNGSLYQCVSLAPPITASNLIIKPGARRPCLVLEISFVAGMYICVHVCVCARGHK